jgi:hypothetical protein
VWLAQQARAWALNHYKIDTERMIISGVSNGADAASGTVVATPFGFNSAILFAPPCGPPLGAVVVPQEADAKGQPVVFIKPLSSSGMSHIKKNWRIAFVCGSNDQFLANVKRSAEATKGIDGGSKLFEVPGLGHSLPTDIADVFDYVFASRKAADGKSGGAAPFNAAPVLDTISAAKSTNPAKAKEMMIQLWNNHPEVRESPEFKELLAEMEKFP